jgi:outer membrane lipoprotein carrier protein
VKRSVLVMVCVGIALDATAAARTQLNGFSQGVRTLQGKFQQSLSDERGTVKDRSSGEVALMAPRQFRWDVLKPFKQHVVADGNAVWVHDVELEQVNVRPQSFDEANSPLAVLLDLQMLDVEFRSKEMGEKNGVETLRLYAKSKNPDFKHCDLAFKGNLLQSMTLLDNFGQRTLIEFSGWRKNPKLDAKLFSFKPPAGVDVVGEIPQEAQIQKIPD